MFNTSPINPTGARWSKCVPPSVQGEEVAPPKKRLTRNNKTKRIAKKKKSSEVDGYDDVDPCLLKPPPEIANLCNIIKRM